MGWIKSGNRTFTAEEFDARARRAATVIAGFGVNKGDGIALYLRNDIAYFEAVFGAGMLGIFPDSSLRLPLTAPGEPCREAVRNALAGAGILG